MIWSTSTSTILINNFNNEGSADVEKKKMIWKIREIYFLGKEENDNDK